MTASGLQQEYTETLTARLHLTQLLELANRAPLATQPYSDAPDMLMQLLCIAAKTGWLHWPESIE